VGILGRQGGNLLYTRRSCGDKLTCWCESATLQLATFLLSSKHPSADIMSQFSSTSASSTNFETIFAVALKEYTKRTKRDIASHTLAAELQSCDSPDAILAVLQKFGQSTSTNEKWMKWVDPTVNVLHAFSVTLGSGVGLVIARPQTSQDLSSDMYGHRYSHPQTQFSLASGYFSK
jgi:hypothetical protein